MRRAADCSEAMRDTLRPASLRVSTSYYCAVLFTSLPMSSWLSEWRSTAELTRQYALWCDRVSPQIDVSDCTFASLTGAEQLRDVK